MKPITCILVLLAAAPAARGQGSPNSVAQSIATSSTAATGSVMITPQNNIGQNSHQIFLYTANAAGGTCAPGLFVGPVNIDGSIDNVTFKQISTDIAQPIFLDTNIQPYVGFAVGVYPYLRIRWTNNAPTQCALSIWYTASVSPQAYSGTPRVVNDQFAFLPFNFSTTGDNIVATGCPGVTANGSGILALYGLYVYNQSAGQNIIVKLGTPGAYSNFIQIPAAPAALQYNHPNTGKPLFVAYLTTVGFSNVLINLTAATPVTGYIIYRCE